jgi:Ca2+/Na+ antiporter
MSMLVAALIFVVLLAVAIAHFLWAVGSPWPIRDRELLARTVIGIPGVTRVPRFASLVVSIAVLVAGVLALALADHTGGGVLLTLVGIALAAIFLGRGLIGYTAGWRARFSAEPFATLDRKNYSPLCIGIGIAYIVLVIMRLI